MKTIRRITWPLLLTGLLLPLTGTPASAKVKGQCSNCHTMHNSQDGGSMAWDASSTPTEYLTRGDCVACHAQNTGDKIITLGTSEIPQVRHQDPSGDLAGGNFGYILGDKGSGASDTKGHNVVDFGNLDDTFAAALLKIPGGINQPGHDDGSNVGALNLTCAGTNGCHGLRVPDTSPNPASGMPAIGGSHHNDTEGVCDVADSSANSFRFLYGVKGYENQIDKWQNVSSASHNEYYGITTPPKLGCGGGDELSCHAPTAEQRRVRPPTGTISGFCATCHGAFHTLENGVDSGIGDDALSPFIRHPTDIVLKGTGEYAAYTTYSPEAPVARTTVTSSPSATVVPGTDAVMCLSCHMAHASDNDDMLRWDYTGMLAHRSDAATGTGCFTCHTTKDDY